MARTASKIVKSIPSTETGSGTLCRTESGQEYLITHNPIKEQFTLWKVLKDGYERISSAMSPLIFEEIIPWKE